MIALIRCGGFVTVQDQGWRTGRSIGLPRSGAMDEVALRVANVLTGNPEHAAGLEIAIGSVSIEFRRAGLIALCGAVEECRLDDSAPAADATIPVRVGSRLTIGHLARQRFLYLAVDGGIDVPPVLGSRSTYLPTRLGGWEGRRLEAGDALPLGSPPATAPPPETTVPRPAPNGEPYRICPAPQLDLFATADVARLEREAYRVSPDSDRMGSRLEGPMILPNVPARDLSEGTCLGAIQIPDGGQPIVLLPDGPTVGGYPKIGAVIGADLGRFAQTPLGNAVHFEWVPVADAQRERYTWVERTERCLSEIRSRYRPR